MKSWIEIDGQALRTNFQMFENLCGKDKVIPVLKSNAYGHGYEPVIRCLKPLNIKMLALNYTHEAETVRALGYTGRILIVGPTAPEDLTQIYQIDAEFFMTGPELFHHWQSMKSPRPKCHIKVDTGMNRQGFTLKDLKSTADEILKHKKEVVGVASHFANVEDVLDQGFANQQLAKFKEARSYLGTHLPAHIASSASAIILPPSRLDYSRVGISFYGMWPSKSTKLSAFKVLENDITLKPALEWKTRIAQTKVVPAHSFIGYGCTFKTSQTTTIGILPIGYNEGYPRIAGDKHAYVLVEGKRCPVVGRICMNMMMVDISNLDNPQTGVETTLIGVDGQETISAENLADWSSTINYEVTTRLPSFTPRRILK